MIPEVLLLDLNKQVTIERNNHAVYSAMSALLDTGNLPNLARFMAKQAEGEWSHAKKLVDYITDRGGVAFFDGLAAVETSNDGAVFYFELALNLERSTTDALKLLHRESEAMDQQTAVFLQWYLMEQVEEVKTAEEVVDCFHRSVNLGDQWVDAWMKNYLTS